MATETTAHLTSLLQRACEGDRTAANAAYQAVYGELRRNARHLMRAQPGDHTLDAEGLLHEAYLKVSRSEKTDWQNRGHFLAVMSRAMRQYLIDYARQKHAAKRGGSRKRVPLTGVVLRFEDRIVDVMALHDALTELERLDPDAARVLELTYFVGLTAAEVATSMATSVRTVERELQFARTWLVGEIGK